jgi:hypothetical protein
LEGIAGRVTVLVCPEMVTLNRINSMTSPVIE